jgi:hypothetical protein
MAKTPKKSFKRSGEQNKDNYKKIIVKTLFEVSKPLTRRELEAATKIEICTLCLPLLQLVKFGTLYVANRDKCSLSGNACFHYALSTWKEDVNAGV